MKTILECKNLCKSFGGLKAVDQVNFKVNEGEIVGIIGPNGAGKTTFFNVCTGVYAPTSGEVWFEGKNISTCEPDQIAGLGMARTFQNIKLFRDMSTLENVKLGFHIQLKTTLIDSIFHTKRYRREETFAAEKGMEMLRRVGIEEYAQMNAGNLPYGIQRKLEIARALALGPKILLLDEPAAGMNPSETMELLQLIRDLNSEGLTIVVIEHDMKFVMSLCQKVLVINFGQKICEGTPEQVTSNEEVKKAYLGERKTEKARVRKVAEHA
jgi:branched-chain amino acid transport system ATP-binding protein